ncbi:MAG: hypothetical protein ABIR53_03875 [Paraperlucidibaca sp.]
MRSVSLHPVALILLILRIAALSAWLVGELHWGPLMAGITAVLASLYLPLAATILGCFGAVQVWGWPVWVAVVVFLPGVVLSIAALMGIGAAGLMAWRKPEMRQAFRWAKSQRAEQERYTRASSTPPEDEPTYTNRRPQQPASGRTLEGEVISSRVDPPS